MIVHIGEKYEGPKTYLSIDVTVFLAGNFEAQRLACYWIKDFPRELKRFPDTIREHFVYSCLLSDHVIQPNANYYQSEITRWITSRYKLLFEPCGGGLPLCSYALSYRKESYAEDAAEKTKTYIGDFPCYHDPITRSRLTSELDRLGPPFVRFGNLAASLSELVIIESEYGGELFEFVRNMTGSSGETIRLLSPLIQMSEEGKYALIPEYLLTKTPGNLPSYYTYLMRATLLKCYTRTLEQLYGAPAQNALYPYYRGILLPYRLYHTDTQLFAYFMGLMPDTKEIIRRMNAKDILELKSTESFQYFLQYYRSFIENLRETSIHGYRRRILQEFETQTDLYRPKMEELVNNQIVADMLLRSIDETAKCRRKTLRRTKDIFSFREIPIYALVSEVSERFSNKYERALTGRLERLRHRKELSGQMSEKVFVRRILPGAEYDLREFLQQKWEIVDGLARRFGQYQHAEGKVVDAKRIREFLFQFETVERAKLALLLLQEIDFVNRNRMTEMFRHYCKTALPAERGRKVVLTNLGGPYDSSHLIGYYLGDVGMELEIESLDLRAILDNKDPAGTAILFVDDNIGSAKQAVDTFRDMLGLVAEKELKEVHELELSAKQIEHLKKFRMLLFTLVGFEEGKRKFTAELSRLGLNVAEPYSFVKSEECIGCFHQASGVFDTPEELEYCRTICAEIGYELFSEKTNWPEELRRERSLGYGNSQKLTVFFYNVPTSTLPMLWKRGKHRDTQWEPLFLRREKK